VIGDWGFFLFLAAADFVMILRVYAMWNRSKTILGVLLFIYVPQVLVNVVWELVYAYPGKTLSVTIDQVLNYKSCNYSTTAPLGVYRTIPRYVLGAALLILAVIPTLRQSVEMYKLTKRWHTDRSMKLLVREGAAYFIVRFTLFPLCPSIALATSLASLASLPKPHTKKLTTRTLSLEPGICFSISSMRSKYPAPN
jgi:hypothetical protein